MLSKSPRSSLLAARSRALPPWRPQAAEASRRPTLPAARSCSRSSCGACHILQNASTKGVQGPNLDLAFKQSVADGLGRSTIEGVVENQIDLPMGNQMPADLVRGPGRGRDVGAYVASAIGKPRRGRRAAGRRAPPRPMRKNVVSIPADPSGQLAYQAKSADGEGRQGDAASRKNDSSVPHNIALKGEARARSSRAARSPRSART